MILFPFTPPFWNQYYHYFFVSKQVIICGGGAKPPLLKKVIGDFLPSSTLLNSIPEDEIIALGAAKEVGF